MITQPLTIPIHVRHLSTQVKNKEQSSHMGETGTAGNKKIQFVNPNTDNYETNIRYAGQLNKKEGIPCYKQGQLRDKESKLEVVVVGSGPSLTTVIDKVREKADSGALIFACKAAIKVLAEAGIKTDYAVTMDPGAHICRPSKIYKAEGVIHIVASSSDPLLFEYLRSPLPWPEWIKTLNDDQIIGVAGLNLNKDLRNVSKEERLKIAWADINDEIKRFKDTPEFPGNIIIFHSATGYQHEVSLYNSLFDNGDCMGGGYNVVNRAVSAAIYMGATKITCAGTDCGWRETQAFYADGTAQRPGVDMCDHGMVDGTPWWTRPDMLASGVALARLGKVRRELIVAATSMEYSISKLKDEQIATKNSQSMGESEIKRRLEQIAERLRILEPELAETNEKLNITVEFEFLGDTLPAKLVDKDEEFLKKCASFGN